MCRPSRYEVQQLLCSKLSKVDIASLALQHGVTVIKNGHVNKGWVGQTLDKVADTVGISAREPDGPDYELKSVHVVQRGGEWLAKETVAITMLSPERLLNESFETSALWHKLSRLILVGHCYPEGRRDSAFVKFVAPVDVSDQILVDKISSFWNEIRDLVRQGRIADYSSRGTSINFIQLRTKGSGRSQSRCPVTGRCFNTRAFYATKNFVRYVRGTMN